MTSKNITELTDAAFKANVLDAKTLVLVDFWATWCGPCKQIVPALEAVADAYVGKLKVVKMDIDTNSKVPQDYRVSSIPTLLFFKDGKAVGAILGVVSRAKLAAEIEKHL